MFDFKIILEDVEKHLDIKTPQYLKIFGEFFHPILGVFKNSLARNQTILCVTLNVKRVLFLPILELGHRHQHFQ